MKVMFVTSSLSYGGAAKILAFVANGLDNRGHIIRIANLLESEKEVQTLSSQIGVKKIITHHVRYIEKIEKIFKLRKYIRDENPNIIVAFKSTPAWITCLAAKGKRIPVVFSERGDPYQERLNRFRTYPYWKMINCAAGAVFQTYGAKEYYEIKLQNRSTVIPNPVTSIDSCIDSDEIDKAIVSFGRFENVQKRYDVMIDAFDAFFRTHPDYKLKLYGTGEDEQIIRQWVCEKQLQNAVEFLGFSKEPYKYMKNGNIFLITSDFEGISNALLEAMAAGFPVVSTDSSPGGARMVIQDHKNGLLVPTGDSKKIAEALAAFANNEQLRNDCAKKAKEVAKCYAPNIILDQWEKYLIEVANNAKE